MKAILLAGGIGARLQPHTANRPKPMLPLGKIPILQIILLQLREAGFTDVILATCYNAHQVEDYFGDGDWLRLNITYSHSHVPLGTAGALRLISDFDRPCLIMNADLLTTVDYADLFAAHPASGSMATVVVCRHQLKIDYGTVSLNDEGRITGYVEKPTIELLVGGGIYVLDPSVRDHMRDGEVLNMPTLLQNLIEQGQTINSYVFEGNWFDIGTPEQYRRAQEAFLSNEKLFLKGVDETAELLVRERSTEQPDNHSSPSPSFRS